MASEADSSLLADTLDSTEISSTQNDKTLRSPIHQYSRPPNDNEPKRDEKGRKIIYCIKCTYGASATTNLRNHLKSKHRIVLAVSDSSTKVAACEKLKQLYDKSSAENDITEFNSHVLKNVLNKDVIEQALLNLITMRNLPLRAVQWPELHVLCQALNPESRSYIPASHTTITKMIDNSFQSQMDIVRKRLQSALSSIHLTVDIWTSPNNYLLLAICAHFINNQEERTKALLGLRTVAGHSGEDQWDALLPVLENFGIVRKLGAIVADNSSTNDSLCRTISQYLLKNEGVEWDPTQQRIRCQGHIINLAVLAFLFQDIIDIKQIESYEEDEESGKELTEKEKKEKQDSFRLMGALGKLHNIVVHIRSSAARTKLYVSYAGRRIPLDNRTRWNSWFYMLTVALDCRSAVDKYVEENLSTLLKDSLTPQDWQLLRMISEFLAPFEKATRKLQGDNATLDQVLPTMGILIEHMDRALKLHHSNKTFTARITCCWEKFDRYYSETDRSPLYAAALILHPKRRTNYIKKCWPKRWQKDTLSGVKNLWEKYRDKHLVSSYEKEPESEAQEELDLFDRIERDIDNKYTRPASQDNYEDYCSRDPYDPKVSAIQWWAQEQQQGPWPRLSAFAFEVLSIPAMSDEPERVFSSGRRTISWDRMQLGVETVEKIECLKSWNRSGVLMGEV